MTAPVSDDATLRHLIKVTASLDDMIRLYEKSEAKVAALRADAERLDWLDAQVDAGSCPGLINDDAGRWAYADSGTQNMPNPDEPIDINTTFFVDAAAWKDSVRAAIDTAIAKGGA